MLVTGNLEKARRPASCGGARILATSNRIRIWAAFVYPTLGKYEQAIQAATKTIELDPDFPVGYCSWLQQSVSRAA